MNSILKIFNPRNVFNNGSLYVYLTIIIVIYYLYYRTVEIQLNEVEVVKHWRPHLDEACHLIKTNDALPMLAQNATFPPKSIFFHETKCKGLLTSRQACVVESAARAHPDHQINVLFTSPVSAVALQQGCLKTLTSRNKNVKLFRVLIGQYAQETPLLETVNNLSSDQLNMHITKIMKYLTMFKHSGIFLALDVVVARPLAKLWKNWVVRESPLTLTTDMFSFSDNKVGRKLAEVAVGFVRGEVSVTRERDLWSYSGPSVLTHVLKLWCTTTDVQVMSLSTCDDLAVYGPELFYPISFHNRQAYFKPADWEKWKEERVFTFHVWEYFTKYNLVTELSLYGKIAAEYCPNIFSYHRDQLVSYPDT